MGDTLVLRIQRYEPGVDAQPRTQDFTLPRERDGSLLDALAYVKDELDPSVTYRWSCRMGVCGSCGMMVDGVPRLACEVFQRDLGPVVVVGPLEHFPIERDLVVDQEGFLDKLTSVRPWLVSAAPPDGPHDTHLQRPEQMAAFHRYSACINCMLCYSACPQFGLDAGFLGPAAIALAHRYNQDSRDGGAEGRKGALQADDGVWGCTLVGYCSVVCPHDVDPAAAIQQEKVSGALDWARSVLWPRGKA